jgi:DNA-binding transcriptional LysR family regulator
VDLDSVALFVEVVKAGSFSAAARHTHTPVATVSRRVSELEKSLNIRLLERSSRHLRMTDAGSVLYEYAARGLEELHAGLLALENSQQALSGTLRLSIPPSFVPWRSLIQNFQIHFPDIKVEIHVTERRLDLVQDGVDVALRVGEVLHDSVVARKLFKYRHRLVASPKLLAKYDSLQEPMQLLNMPCASWNDRVSAPVWNLGGKGYNIRPYLQVNDYLHLQALALTGDCVTELPPFLAQPAIAEGTLQALLPGFPLLEREIYLLYPSRRQVSRLVKAYVDFCLKELKD